MRSVTFWGIVYLSLSVTIAVTVLGQKSLRKVLRVNNLALQWAYTDTITVILPIIGIASLSKYVVRNISNVLSDQ